MLVGVVQSGDVTLGQIDDVYVIAHAGATLGGVVVAVDVELIATVSGDLSYIRREAIGYALSLLHL